MDFTSKILITVPFLFASILVCISDNIQIRLRTGYHRCHGQMEIYNGLYWNLVCSTNLNMNHARVACKQLSCGVPVSIYTDEYFGDDNTVALNLWCNGSESAFSDCLPSDPQLQKCPRAESFGLECSGSLNLRIGNSLSCAGVVYISSYSSGYISGEGWNINDANVVCRHAECGFALSIASSTFHDLSYYNVLEKLECLGTEHNVEACPGITMVRGTDRNSTFAQVVCSKDNLSLRLVNGSTLCSGRLEVYDGLHWLTVCGRNWTMNHAKAVCAQLGCGFPVQVNSDDHYGQGYGDIFPQDILCSGNETFLMDCDVRQTLPSICTHDHDVNVICSGLRLVNGTNRCSGIVEVNDGSQWGSICSANWDMARANVICRHLRCGSALSVQTRNLYGDREGPILLSDLQCDGSEHSLSQCSARQFGNYFCNSSQVAAVECSEEKFFFQKSYYGYYGVRIRGEGSYNAGRVDVYSYNHSIWGTISGSQWDINDARVLCRSLGYGFALAAYNSSEYLKGSGAVWFEAHCFGNESHLSQCPLTLLGPPDLHTSDAAVKCTGYYDSRIVNGTNPSAGNVEIYYDGSWSSVSTEGWDIYDANVLCRSQIRGFALAAVTDFSFGEVSGPMLFKNIQCSGTEAGLSKCGGEILPNNIVTSAAAAGVICSSGQLIVRLVNGTNRCSGLLEVNRFSSWERACCDNCNSEIATVVCRELLCGEPSSVQTNSSIENGQEGVWMNNFNCYGHEFSLSECSSQPWSNSFCNSSHQLHITCTGQPFKYGIEFSQQQFSCSEEVQFYSYTFEYTHKNAPVVDWDIEDANTVCRQRKCGLANAAIMHREYGRKSAWMSFQCTGQEFSLSSCPLSIVDSDGTLYWSYATVNCSDPDYSYVHKVTVIPPLCISIVVLLLVVIFIPQWRCRHREDGAPEKYHSLGNDPAVMS